MPPEPKRHSGHYADFAGPARPNLYVVDDSASGIGELAPRYSARTPPVAWQRATLVGLGLTLIGGVWLAFDLMAGMLYWLCWGVFMASAGLRLAAALCPDVSPTAPP